MQKGQAGCPGCPLDAPNKKLFGNGRFAETVAEFLHAAAHVINRLLRACVERVGLAGRVQLVQRQLAAVFHGDHFFGVSA